MTKRYDVLVLGSGNAGLAASRVTREAGKSVAVVESGDVGGTCPLRGCVPKKVLVAAAETLQSIADADRHHIEVASPKLDWQALIRREQSFTKGVSGSFDKSLSERDIDLLRGRAAFVDRNRVRIDDKEVEAGKIVIATGSVPREVPVEGAENLVTSDDLLQMEELPESVVFIGGGVIALEFSHVLTRAGSKVTILEMAPRLLSQMEEDIVSALADATAGAGIEVVTSAAVTSVKQDQKGLKVAYGHGGEDHEVTAACVVNGTGRVPDVEELDLDAAGIDHEGPRILHDSHLASSSNGDVYVCGDANADSPQLSPLATFEGKVAGQNILEGNTRTADHRSVPSVVFSIPALASVGLTEHEANEHGLDFEVHDRDMSEWLSARLYGGEGARGKVLVEKESDRILGAHLFGKRAEEIIHLFAFAMAFHVSAGEVKSMVPVFPTFSSEVSSLL